MAKLFKSVVCALAVSGAVVIMACGGGGGNPKSLAKQGADVMVEFANLMKDGAKEGDAKYDAMMKKSNAIKAKVDKLSEADKKAYNDELGKLLNQ